MLKRLLAGLCFCFASCGGGCFAPTGFPAELGQVVVKLTEMVEDQGVLSDFTSNIEGDIFNPGIESYMIIGGGVRLVGVQGSVDLDSRGTGTRLPKGAREKLIQMLSQPIGDELRAEILRTLGWNRVESPHNPVVP